GHVVVTGSTGGPFNIILSPVGNPGGTVTSSTAATATLVTTAQALGLVTSGVANLSFSGVSGTSPLVVTPGVGGTTAAAVQAVLNTIPTLNGSAAVSGPNGGPFTIIF